MGWQCFGYAVERDLRSVQELLGHQKIETTTIYTKVPDDAMRRAASAATLASAPDSAIDGRFGLPWRGWGVGHFRVCPLCANGVSFEASSSDDEEACPVPARAGARLRAGRGPGQRQSGPCARGREGGTRRRTRAVRVRSLRARARAPCGARRRRVPAVRSLRARARGTRCHLFLGCMPLSPAGAGARNPVSPVSWVYAVVPCGRGREGWGGTPYPPRRRTVPSRIAAAHMHAAISIFQGRAERRAR